MNKKYLTEEERKEAKRKSVREYYLRNKEKTLENKKQYREKNKKELQEKKNIYRKLQKEINPLYKITNSLRRNINNAFKRHMFSKNINTEKIIGCSFEEFKIHLESKFESWMTWENYGLYNGTEGYGWDIDHMIPLATAKTEEELLKLNHFNNLQPLCSFYNRIIKR